MTGPLRKLLAITLLAHLLGVVALAAFPHWHEEVHHDAGEQDHECAVTEFLSGAADHGMTPPVFTAVSLKCVEVLRMAAAREVFLVRIEGRIRERAPPGAAV